MVETLWKRLESVMGVHPLTVVAVRDALGISYQAAVKLSNGGNFSRDNNLRVAKKYGVNPEWLASGKGPKLASHGTAVPPPAPSAGARPFGALTPDEMAFLEDFRALLDPDREHYRQEIGEKARAMNEHMAKVLKDIQNSKTIKDDE